MYRRRSIYYQVSVWWKGTAPRSRTHTLPQGARIEQMDGNWNIPSNIELLKLEKGFESLQIQPITGSFERAIASNDYA